MTLTLNVKTIDKVGCFVYCKIISSLHTIFHVDLTAARYRNHTRLRWS